MISSGTKRKFELIVQEPEPDLLDFIVRLKQGVRTKKNQLSAPVFEILAETLLDIWMDSAPASPPMSGASIDISNRAFEIHRRRRKHEDASKNSNGQDSNSPSQKTKRKPIPIWTVFKSKLFSGDRKKDCVGIVVVFVFLSIWISSWHFEYKLINEGNNNSVFGIEDRNNYIRTKHATNMGSGSSGRRASHAYDSIFCPAGSFKNTAVDNNSVDEEVGHMIGKILLSTRIWDV